MKFKQRAENANAFLAGSFTAWIGHIFKSATPVKIFKRIYRYFRRITLIRTVIAVSSYILTFLGTGVAFLIVTALFLVIMPLLALVCFALVFASLFDRKKLYERMTKALNGKNVFVFIPSRSDGFDKSRFFRGNCLDLAKGKDRAVLIVSPYYIFKKVIGGKKLFFSVREESKNVYIVRRYAFFYLRKHLLDRSDGQTVYFY